MTQNEHVCAIFCRPEVADDVISGENVKTLEGYFTLQFETVSLSTFRANQNQPCVQSMGELPKAAIPEPNVPQTEGLQIGHHRLSTSCVFVEPPDHHCGGLTTYMVYF